MTRQHTVLVVDDDPTIVLFCETVLAHAGFRVVSAATAAEGLAAARAERPDLVVVDIMMEEVDSGFKMVHRLAEMHPGLPILMLSSIAGASSKVFDLSGFPISDLVDKPIEAAVLVQKVRHLLRLG